MPFPPAMSGRMWHATELGMIGHDEGPMGSGTLIWCGRQIVIGVSTSGSITFTPGRASFITYASWANAPKVR